MKLEAHPLVVAVALGLLGPGALVADEDDTDGASYNEDGDGPTTTVAEWEPGVAPNAEEFHRVEIEWLKLERS